MRDISLHLMDILQNSITAHADTIIVRIWANKTADEMGFEVTDNGTGMDKELLDKVTNPFVTARTTRKVGLGIPLLEASTQRTSGGLEINSEKGVGTNLKASFRISHIDRPPLGSVGETMASVIMAQPEIGLELKLENENIECFNFNTADVKKTLEDVPITQFDVITWIKEYIDEGIKNIFGGVLDEIHS